MNQIAQWQDIEPGDLPNIEKSMKETISSCLGDSIKGTIKEGEGLKFDKDGICTQFEEDARGNVFEMGGVRIDRGSHKGSVAGKFKEIFTNQADRKFLSGLMNQSTLANIMHLNTGASDPSDKSKDPQPWKDKDFAGVHVATSDMNSSPMWITQPDGTSSTFKLEQGENGTAKLTVSSDYNVGPSPNMLSQAGSKESDTAFVKVGYTMVINIEGLSTGNPSIKSLDLSQKIREA